MLCDSKVAQVCYARFDDERIQIPTSRYCLQKVATDLKRVDVNSDTDGHTFSQCRALVSTRFYVRRFWRSAGLKQRFWTDCHGFVLRAGFMQKDHKPGRLKDSIDVHLKAHMFR